MRPNDPHHRKLSNVKYIVMSSQGMDGEEIHPMGSEQSIRLYRLRPGPGEYVVARSERDLQIYMSVFPNAEVLRSLQYNRKYEKPS